MRVLVVLSRVPWPLEKGDKLRAYHFIRELSKTHEVLLFCLSDQAVSPDAERKLKEYCSEVYIHRFPRWQLIWRLLIGLFSPRPFQVSYFHSKKAQEVFDRFLEAHLPQDVFCQLIRTAEYVRRYTVLSKSMDYMDALSAGMMRMASTASWPVSIAMRMEAKRLANYEREVYPLFRQHYIISEQDRDQLELPGPLTVVPNGVDPKFLQIRRGSDFRWNILFTGNMSYRPNVESSRFLVKEVMPIVWKSHPNLNVCLAGANPAPTVKALASDRVEVTGWVDDIAEVYQQSQLFVAPMLINSGLQNKLLEAMASSMPAITTTLANNALGAEPDKEIITADTATDIANAIIKLVSDSSVQESLATNGKQYVQSTFSWEQAAQIINNYISQPHG